MEVLPNAVQLMAKATQDAGLSVNGTVAEMNKLMEQGKLLSADVLPHFARNMRTAANANGALDQSLEKNLNPALGRTLLTVQDLSNEIFKGLKPSVMFALDGFNEMGKESRSLANGIGAVLGGAILGLTFPIKLVSSAFQDLRFIMKDTFNITDEAESKFFKLAGTVVGLATSFVLMAKAAKLAKSVLGGAKAMASTGAKGASVMKQAGPTTGSYSVGGAASNLSKVGKFGGALSAVTALYEGYDRLSTTNERNAAVIAASQSSNPFAGGRLSNMFGGGGDKTPVQINISPDPRLGSIIQAEVQNGFGMEYDNAYMNINANR